MPTSDFHVQFDAVNARRYQRRISASLAALVAIAAAIASAPLAAFQAVEDKLHVGVDGLFSETAAPDIAGAARFALVPIAAIAVIALGFLLLVLPWLLRKNFEAQRCTITATQIVCESGWLNRTTQVVPLDRIQDLSVKQGFLQRRFGLHTVEIQTAGSSSPFPEAVLHAPQDAHRVREEIMKRRDALLRSGAVVSAAGTRALDGERQSIGEHDTAAATVDALAELNRTMLRIEHLLAGDKDAAARATRGD